MFTGVLDVDKYSDITPWGLSEEIIDYGHWPYLVSTPQLNVCMFMCVDGYAHAYVALLYMPEVCVCVGLNFHVCISAYVQL